MTAVSTYCSFSTQKLYTYSALDVYEQA